MSERETERERLEDIKSRYLDYKGRERPGNLKKADRLFAKAEAALAAAEQGDRQA